MTTTKDTIRGHFDGELSGEVCIVRSGELPAVLHVRVTGPCEASIVGWGSLHAVPAARARVTAKRLFRRRSRQETIASYTGDVRSALESWRRYRAEHGVHAATDSECPPMRQLAVDLAKLLRAHGLKDEASSVESAMDPVKFAAERHFIVMAATEAALE